MGKPHATRRGGSVKLRTLSRPIPKLPVLAMRTYAIKSPISTHTRPATCEEAGCMDFLRGWVLVMPRQHGMVPLLRRAARQAIDMGDGRKRKCTVTQEDGNTVTFKFDAGQPCVKASEHRVSLNRPENYFVRGGDWRGSTGLIRRHTKPEFWVEDMQERLDQIRDR